MVSASVRKQQQDEHEAFKNRLVEEVLGQEDNSNNDDDDVNNNNPVQMEKVVMLMWAFRSDPSVVTYMARFVAKYSGSRRVFDGIEFYLPQLAHMIIHLEVEWDDAILERFALVIAQQSLHFALQLHWILQGALEDYQPQVAVTDHNNPSSGTIYVPNPTYHPVFYQRCLSLARNVERVVVYGKPRAKELLKLYETGKITKTEMVMMEQADRRFNALQITNNSNDDNRKNELEGWMGCSVTTVLPGGNNITNTGSTTSNNNSNANANTTTTAEKQRFCSLEGHVLNIFKPPGCCAATPDAMQLESAVSIQNASVTKGTGSHSLNASAVAGTQRQQQPKLCIKLATGNKIELAFQNTEEANLWKRRLEEEASTQGLFRESSTRDVETKADGDETTDSTNDKNRSDKNDDHKKESMEERLVQDLTPAQWNRYQFYKNERKFVSDLVQIAEDLRFKDRAERKRLAPGLMEKLDIPDRVYSPLCNSSDIWRRIDKALFKETRVFNTKERCPTVMQFLAVRGEPVSLLAAQGKGSPAGNFTNAAGSNFATRMDPDMDVAGYMHNCLEVRQEDPNMESLVENPNEDDGEDEVESKPDDVNDNNTSTDAGGNDPLSDSKHDSVWLDDDETEPVAPGTAKKGNRRVQRLVRDSVALPAILARRLKKTGDKKPISVIDKQTKIQPQVAILAGTHSVELSGGGTGSLRRIMAEQKQQDSDNNSVGNSSHVSVERSSMMINHTIVPGDQEEGDIDPASINKAKDFVSGGESWAETTGRMLNQYQSDDDNEDDGLQKEIVSCLAKSNDDLRQEVFVMQMIHYYKSVFAQAKLPLWLKTYRILSTSKDTGILELLTDATSLDGLKKSDGYPTEGGLRKYFEVVYGDPKGKAFKAAQTNFMQSLAGYAIVSYLLGLKDRHNGNVMIDTRGHLIHIDFGFAFGMAPGHEFSMERAPFKLTKEYVEVMGGVGSDCYKEFQRLFVAGFQEARKNSQIALGLVEIMMFKSNYPCFVGRRYGNGKALGRLEKRLMLRVPDHKVERKALALIRKSRNNSGTYLYDRFQLATNGYAM